jgi:hypothetical protein
MLQIKSQLGKILTVFLVQNENVFSSCQNKRNYVQVQRHVAMLIVLHHTCKMSSMYDSPRLHEPSFTLSNSHGLSPETNFHQYKAKYNSKTYNKKSLRFLL